MSRHAAAPQKRPARRSAATQEARPTRRHLLRSLIGGGAALAALGLGVADAQACQPTSYCRTGGNCISIGQVQRQVAAQFGGQGYRVARVRLVSHAPTPTCLWYEVVLRHASRPAQVIYWGIRGGRAG